MENYTQVEQGSASKYEHSHFKIAESLQCHFPTTKA